MNISNYSTAAFLTATPVTTTKSFTCTTTSTTTSRPTPTPKTPTTVRRTRPIRNAVASPPLPPISLPSRYFKPEPFEPCTPILGREAFDAALNSHAPDEPIVIMFHAAWCRTCKTLRHKLPKVAAQFPGVQWYDVDFVLIDNKPLVRDLGVKYMPTFRIYLGGQDKHNYVDDFSTGAFGSDRLVEHLNTFLASNPQAPPVAVPEEASRS